MSWGGFIAYYGCLCWRRATKDICLVLYGVKETEI